MEQEKRDLLMTLVQKGATVEEVCEKAELKAYEVFGIVELLKQDGYLIDFVDNQFLLRKEQIVKERDVYQLPQGKSNRIMFVSDTHGGSKYDRFDILRDIYSKAAERGIDTVFHVGDLVDGNYGNRPQHTYELRVHGADEQIEYIVKKYPKIEGIKTVFINGNHDYTHIRSGGMDTGKAVAKERKDMVYLGQDVADVRYGKTRIRLFHGQGKGAYARSYRLQKYVEQIPMSERPQILATGHYHNSFYMKYSGIHCFQVPAVIDQTPFARSLGLQNEKGAWDVSFTTDPYGDIITLQPELLDYSGQKKLIRRK